MGRRKRVMDCFVVDCVVSLSYSESFTSRSIQSGFERTWFWDPRKLSVSIAALKDLPCFNLQTSVQSSVMDILRTFLQKGKGSRVMQV